MANELQGKKIAFLAADGVEQVELTEPWKAVEEAGGEPELLSIESGEIRAFNHLDHGDTFPVDREVAQADAADYDGLVLPGGSQIRTCCAGTRRRSALSATSSGRGSRSESSATGRGRS
jgi:hypothetical protein